MYDPAMTQYSVATLDNRPPVILQQPMFAHSTLTAADIDRWLYSEKMPDVYLCGLHSADLTV